MEQERPLSVEQQREVMIEEISHMYDDPDAARETLLAAIKEHNYLLVDGQGNIRRDFVEAQHSMRQKREETGTKHSAHLLSFHLDASPSEFPKTGGYTGDAVRTRTDIDYHGKAQ